MNEQQPAPLAVSSTYSPALAMPSFVLSIPEMVARIEAKRQFFAKVMRKGEHYGLPPGMEKKGKDGKEPKPSLFKSGAELLLSSMGYSAVITEDQPSIKDYKGTLDGEPLIAFYHCCSIYKQIGPGKDDRILIAQASGCCTSRESKYRYRSTRRTCPLCKAQAIFPGKKDEAGNRQWFCSTRENGCGVNYDGNDHRILSQPDSGRGPNPDIADQENAILKISQKRAMVAATLIATGCSDIFTQDLEDLAADDEPRNVTPRDEPPAKGRKSNDAPPKETAKQTQQPPPKSDEQKLADAHAALAKLIAEKQMPDARVEYEWLELMGNEQSGAFPNWQSGTYAMLRSFYGRLAKWEPPKTAAEELDADLNEFAENKKEPEPKPVYSGPVNSETIACPACSADPGMNHDTTCELGAIT